MSLLWRPSHVRCTVAKPKDLRPKPIRKGTPRERRISNGFDAKTSGPAYDVEYGKATPESLGSLSTAFAFTHSAYASLCWHGAAKPRMTRTANTDLE
jgi:hypothetical protein